MSKFFVFQNNKNHDLFYRIINGEFVGSFESDSSCDYVMNMIRLNDTLEHPDPFWTKEKKRIDKEGI